MGSKYFGFIFSCLFVFSLFYKTFLFGLLPFPGDLLIAEYSPWKYDAHVGYSPGSYPNKAQYFDSLRQMYPWRMLGITSFSQGFIPLWNPYNFSGAPLLANFQSAVFYPLNIVFLILSEHYAWTGLIILQIFLALWFTYLYAKEIGLSHFGSMFSAISFVCSSFVIVWLEYNTIVHVILWLPLILLSIENLVKAFTKRWAFVLLFSLSSSILAGHPQVFFYLYLFTFIYFIWKLKSLHKHIRNETATLTCLLLPLGLTAFQILPGIELTLLSARSSHDISTLLTKILIQPWQLIMAFVPDFFGNPANRNYYISDTYIGKMFSIGIIPSFFAFYALFTKRRGYIQLFFITTIIILLLTVHSPFTWVLYAFPIPFFSASSPTLSLFLIVFSTALLSGFGVDLWLREKQTVKIFLKRFSQLPLFFLGIWMYLTFAKTGIVDSLLPEQLSITIRNFLLISAILFFAFILVFISSFFLRYKKIFFLVLLFISLGESFRNFHKFNPFVPEPLIFPKNEIFTYLQSTAATSRFYGYGAANIQANFGTYYHNFSPDGYDPLYPKSYGEFIALSRDGAFPNRFTTETRSDAMLAPGFGDEDFTENTYRIKVMNLLGVSYILDREENGSTAKRFPPGQFPIVYKNNNWIIYKNVDSLQRAFFASSYQLYKNEKDFEKIFFSKNFDYQKTILLEKPLGEKAQFAIGKAEISTYSPNKIIIKTENTGDGLLFLSDTFFPGWKAFIDEKETVIHKADFTFRAVLVPPGRHSVRFIYDPDSFKIGIVISLLSMIIASIFLFFKKKVSYNGTDL